MRKSLQPLKEGVKKKEKESWLSWESTTQVRVNGRAAGAGAQKRSRKIPDCWLEEVLHCCVSRTGLMSLLVVVLLHFFGVKGKPTSDPAGLAFNLQVLP